jgi:hypothetical protein
MVKRRNFLLSTGAVTGLISSPVLLAQSSADTQQAPRLQSPPAPCDAFDGRYEEESLDQVVFPLG